MAVPIYTKYQPFSVGQNMQAANMGRQQGMLDNRQRALTDVYADPSMTYGERANALMPYAPDIAQNMITNAQNQQKLATAQQKANQGMFTSDMKNFVAGGGNISDGPGFAQYQERMAGLRRPVTNVNTNMPKIESEFQKTVGKDLGKMPGHYREVGDIGSRRLQGVRQMQELLKTTPTGWTEDMLLGAKNMLAGMGFLSPEQIGTLNKQTAIKALAIDFTLDQTAKLKGAISNKEIELLGRSVANLANQPGGNLIILGIQEKLARRQIQVARMAAEHYAQNGYSIASQQALEGRLRQLKAQPILNATEIQQLSRAGTEQPKTDRAARKKAAGFN